MKLFKFHGTKIIGALTTAVGVAATADPTVLAAAFGPKGLAYFTLASGVLTTLRGIQSTPKQPPTQ